MKSKFHIGILAGLLVTQIQGDDLGGYHKLGGSYGVSSLVTLPKNFRLLVEINYDQFGSSSNKNETTTFVQKINADYLSIPILGNYQFHDFSFSVGIAVSSLVRFKAIDISGADISVTAKQSMRPINIMSVLDLNYHFKGHWTAAFRFQYSLTSALKKNQDPWRHNGLGFRMGYTF